LKAVTHGAWAIMLKDAAADSLVNCLQNVAKGERWLPPELVSPALSREAERRNESERLDNVLTAREREISILVADGLSCLLIGATVLLLWTVERTAVMSGIVCVAFLGFVVVMLGVSPDTRIALPGICVSRRTEETLAPSTACTPVQPSRPIVAMSTVVPSTKTVLNETTAFSGK